MPICAIFGGNASGKTNLFEALKFAQNFVVNGTHPDQKIRVKPFLLSSHINKKTKFEFELYVDETIYHFKFIIDKSQVYQEKLSFYSGNKLNLLYVRNGKKFKFGEKFLNDKKIKKENKNIDLFLDFLTRRTRHNQLFLTSTIFQDLDVFRPIYNWFAKSVAFVGPNHQFGSYNLFFDECHPYYVAMNKVIPKLNVGISSLRNEKVSFDQLNIPSEIKEDIVKDAYRANFINLQSIDGQILISAEQGELIARRLMTFHKDDKGENVKFEFGDESHGTKRVMDLLPVFLSLVTQNRIFVIDDFDQSMHSILTERLLESYLETCEENTRSQLIIMTQDLNIMDSRLLRKDEMWLTEREDDGSSNLVSMCEFEDLVEGEIRTNYLQGRMGGIPQIQAGGLF